MSKTEAFGYYQEMIEKEVQVLIKRGTKPNGPFDDKASIDVIALETTAIRYEIRGLRRAIEEVKKLKDKKEGVHNDARL